MTIPVGSVIGRAGLVLATLSISATPSSYAPLTTPRSSPSSDPTSQPQQHTIALPLGLGLGLGIPLSLVLISTLFYFARFQRRTGRLYCTSGACGRWWQ